ncbi:MAG TPA: O-antigen ligase family protein [Pyrinomonadaceae bacterium]|nr:O-antigen ligase family protein [Pyrinomonadaceae bacterium]
MPADKKTSTDYRTLRSAATNGGVNSIDNRTLQPAAKRNRESEQSAPKNLINPGLTDLNSEKVTETIQGESISETPDAARVENSFPATKIESNVEIDYADTQKQRKREKKSVKDRKLLSADRWLAKRGHTLTYAGIFLFTLTVYFRPYELIPGLSGLSSMALIIAIATLLIYLPTQLAAENSLTIFSTEVKCILFMTVWAVLTIPIAKSPALAWETFNDTFSKVVLIFVVMVNTLRTQKRLKGLMWLSIGVGVLLSYQALNLYRQGIFKTEGYRVNVDFGGMFGNPNDMALHLVIFTPIAVALGFAAKNKLARLVYLAAAMMMIAGNSVTQSRGGFLGLLAVGAVLVWKFGKKQRFKVVLISAVVGLIFILVAPGNYGLRILSIFIPSLDQVGSSDQRSELLKLSLLVTLRNPQGIGIGNFPIVGIRNLDTHNAFTQVSSELGWLAAFAYITLIVSPLRKLAAVERQLFASSEDDSWIYYLSIGIQASIVGYMVSSFFAPVAYNWFLYYPIAYAVCLRRIYQIRQAERGIEFTGKKIEQLFPASKSIDEQRA